MKIVVDKITFLFKGQDVPLFENLSLDILGPGFYSLFGFSGCGKSTLARLISGLLLPSSGSVRFYQINKCLLCYNTERLPGWYPVGDHLKKNCPANKGKLLAELINEFGLKNLLSKRFFRLSMGQKNRVNLIRYLIQDFDVLICDEVLANVDEPSRNHILSIIKEKFKNKIILYISHNVEEVGYFSKEILILPQKLRINKEDIKRMPGLNCHLTAQVHKKGLEELVLKLLRFASFSVRA